MGVEEESTELDQNVHEEIVGHLSDLKYNHKEIYLSIYLLTYMGVFGLDFVSKLLPDEAAQTHNP